MQPGIRMVKRAMLAIAVVAAPVLASAQTINISTGVDAAGTPLAYGSVDPFWTISTQGNPFTAALVMYPAGMCCNMSTVDETRARWITDVTSPTSATTGWGVGPTAILRRQFDLTGYDLASVAINGEWRFADYFGDLNHGFFLNGARLFGVTGSISNWDTDHAFSVNAGFVAGVNTLEVRGYSINSTWDGLYVDAAVSGRLLPTTPVPEPSSIALVATGALALAAVARRRRMS